MTQSYRTAFASLSLGLALGLTSGLTAAPLAAIPDRFHGTWDDVACDCSTNSDALLRISASEMRFYESVSKITKVEADGDAIIVTTLSSGEGETWESALRLSITGDTLSMKVVGAAWGPFERKRCPNLEG